ncbi:ABC transporter ATP-binding protein [Citreimonas sp.]|uniref:ABC transporter ATP-binding protein n=1 Tax=Citreimonas sp. TaxID=3036715 RepID=UPI004059C81D
MTLTEPIPEQQRARPRRSRTGAHLAVRGLGHTYRWTHDPVLSDISFEVEPGEIVALLGRSGCGKSTLLHMISGLSQPSAGQVVIDGNTVREASPRWVFMFQSPSLLPWLTVAQNVAMGLKFTRRSGEIAKRVPEVLDLVEMGTHADRNVQDLSGGQQQRVALARSLAPKPEMLLLDEPFSALDAFTRRSLQYEVRAIARDLGLTIVMVSHDVSEAVRMADRAILLDSGPGRVVQDVAITLDERERKNSDGRYHAELKTVMGMYSDIAGETMGPVLD